MSGWLPAEGLRHGGLRAAQCHENAFLRRVNTNLAFND